MKKIKVQNYASFSPIENGEKKYKIITSVDGQELGIEVKGTVKIGRASCRERV